MKFSFSLRIALFLLCLTNCSQEKPISTQPTEATLPDSASAVVAPVSIQHAAPAAEAVVRNMLRWYARSMEKLPADFVLNDDGTDTTKFYAVNFPGTEAWLTSLKASGFFSDVYLNSWRTYFRQHDDSLRVHPQNDGPPAGFEYDFILYSQEADSKVQELQSGNYSSSLSDANHALVEITGRPYNTDGGSRQEGLSFKISKSEGGYWLIDDITALVYSVEGT